MGISMKSWGTHIETSMESQKLTMKQAWNHWKLTFAWNQGKGTSLSNNVHLVQFYKMAWKNTTLLNRSFFFSAN
ncbi:hypothetical protein XENTR_v10006512 [Xenopus tropicalis]|nr:hypothetical protein XENTR_v10006512 [Xenopus tropicalis]